MKKRVSLIAIATVLMLVLVFFGRELADSLYFSSHHKQFVRSSDLDDATTMLLVRTPPAGGSLGVASLSGELIEGVDYKGWYVAEEHSYYYRFQNFGNQSICVRTTIPLLSSLFGKSTVFLLAKETAYYKIVDVGNPMTIHDQLQYWPAKDCSARSSFSASGPLATFKFIYPK